MAFLVASVNSSMQLGVDVELLPKTEGFLICVIKCIYDPYGVSRLAVSKAVKVRTKHQGQRWWFNNGSSSAVGDNYLISDRSVLINLEFIAKGQDG
jgi:hypothetical protein